jgi:hydrogenase-4 membrane subunit HyfE
MITMANIVRTVTQSTFIAQYVGYCKEEEFSPLSKCMMYRALNVMEALQGLDNIAAVGAASFVTYKT